MELNKELAAVCGLYCGACGVYIATHEDENRLKSIAAKFNQTIEETKCNGCRSDKKTPYCNSCNFTKCASQKGIDFCGECVEYPCTELKDFQLQFPHRIELWESQKKIKETGWENWMSEMNKHYSCSKCATINSAYDINCRKCGEIPPSEYSARHKEAIQAFLEKR